MDVKDNVPENMQKHFNYKEQFKRLKKAIDNNFYLEAILLNMQLLKTELNQFFAMKITKLKVIVLFP